MSPEHPNCPSPCWGSDVLVAPVQRQVGRRGRGGGGGGGGFTLIFSQTRLGGGGRWVEGRGGRVLRNLGNLGKAARNLA